MCEHLRRLGQRRDGTTSGAGPINPTLVLQNITTVIMGKRASWRTMLRSGEAPLGFRQAPPPPVPMPMSHFLVRPRRAAATRTNAAIDASRRGANVNF